MTGHSIAPRHEVRLSRKKLRDWLEAEGPQSLERIVVKAKLHAPAATREQVERELAGNPELFEPDTDGRWAAHPRKRFVVVDAKPRPRPKARGKHPQTAQTSGPRTDSRRSSSNRHPPLASDPIAIEEGRVACLTFLATANGAGAPAESGRHLLVPMPQGAGPFADRVLEGIIAACAATTETDVYAVYPGRPPVFRGRRALLDSRKSPDGTRIHIVLGPGDDDEGRLGGLLRSGQSNVLLLPRFVGAAAGSGDTRADLVATPRETRVALGELIELSADARRMALLPSPRSKFNRRLASDEANRRLQEVRLDSTRWANFHEWLARRKAEYDQELLQDILRAALSLANLDPIAVFRLAKLLMEESADIRPEFATAFCVRLSERLLDDAAIAWAETLLPIATAANPANPAILLAGARIALHRGRGEDAAHLFADAAKVPGATLGAADIEEFLLAAVSASDVPLSRTALQLLERSTDALSRLAQLAQFRGALEYGVEAALLCGSLNTATDLLDRLILLLLDISAEEVALKKYETFAHGRRASFRDADRLRLLSTLARCESKECLVDVLVLTHDVLQRAWDNLREPDREAAVSDLRYAEYLAGEITHRYARDFEERLAHRRARGPRPATRELRLAGKVIVVIGGRPSTRQRVSRELRIEHGAKEVREIPPSWEMHLDEQSIRAKTENADFVLQITDCIKHDAHQIIRSLTAGGARFEHVATQGGPSRITRDLLTHVSRTAT